MWFLRYAHKETDRQTDAITTILCHLTGDITRERDMSNNMMQHLPLCTDVKQCQMLEAEADLQFSGVAVTQLQCCNDKTANIIFNSVQRVSLQYTSKPTLYLLIIDSTLPLQCLGWLVWQQKKPIKTYASYLRMVSFGGLRINYRKGNKIMICDPRKDTVLHNEAQQD